MQESERKTSPQKLRKIKLQRKSRTEKKKSKNI